jgi:HD-GYP domain-containing protein (c-di-GMP phosphodiesterase class II)/DNA-binding CsgD family transcriptional regulator
MGTVAEEDLRLADLLTALSVVTDLGMGHEPEKAIRTCLLATELARAAELPGPQVRDVYYSSMVLHLGCTAPGHELTHMVGDDRAFLAVGEAADTSTLRGSLQLLGAVGRGTGAARPRHLARTLTAGRGETSTILRSTCEVGSRLAERLHLGDGVRAALRDSTEVWDGSEGAFRRAGEEIALPARFALLASQVIHADLLGGVDAATAVVRERTGRWFDPAIAATFAVCGPELLRRHAEVDVWHEVLAIEPDPSRRIPSTGLDDLARVFADVVDLRSTFTLGHSTGVADLAADAAHDLAMGAEEVALVRLAGLLHDLGRLAVSGAVWERPGPLTTTQWEQVRLHPYHTERILDRSTALAPVARIAGMHHERHDGSGYHHGLRGGAIPPAAGVLAAADAFQARTQPRPHRLGLPPERAASDLEADAAAGALDTECVRAVVEAAGQAVTGPSSWPCGLTDREVEVLRLVARGASNRAVATSLVISRRTAEHHVQHIYAKIGASTRAAAALFAMEHGLVR